MRSCSKDWGTRPFTRPNFGGCFGKVFFAIQGDFMMKLFHFLLLFLTYIMKYFLNVINIILTHVFHEKTSCFGTTFQQVTGHFVRCTQGHTESCPLQKKNYFPPFEDRRNHITFIKTTFIKIPFKHFPSKLFFTYKY